jgi:hypothetical protein
MPHLAPMILAAMMVLLAIGVVVSLFRGLTRSARMHPTKPIIPILPVNPPELITERTIGVELVGWTSIVWSVAHLAILVIWAVSLPDSILFNNQATTIMSMAYLFIAATITGIGGIMMLKLMAYGRRAIAWGLMLFGLMGIFGMALCLMLRDFEQGPFYQSMHQAAFPLVAALGIHVVANTLLGAIAQRVGKTPREGNI